MAFFFQMSFFLTVPFWLLMLAVPHWHWTKRVIRSCWVVVPVALLYVFLNLSMIGQLLPLLVNPTLAGITRLLGSEAGATAAWTHMLTFDLFVGRWVFLDGYERRFSRWLMTPILFFIAMVGPLGLVLYLLIRTVFGK
jgi:hypothetical protein